MLPVYIVGQRRTTGRVQGWLLRLPVGAPKIGSRGLSFAVRCSELDAPYTAEDRARDAHGEEGPITLLHVLEQSILRVMAPPNFLDSCLVSQVRENACFGCKCPTGPKGDRQPGGWFASLGGCVPKARFDYAETFLFLFGSESGQENGPMLGPPWRCPFVADTDDGSNTPNGLTRDYVG